MKRTCLLLSLLVSAACGDKDVTPPPPAVEPTVLEVLSALPATGTVGDVVQVLVLARTAQTRRPVGNKAVSFRVEAGGGAVTPATVTTDSLGRAQANWTLGNAPGNNVLSATADTSTVRATVVTTAGIPARLTVERGANQTAQVGGALRDTIVVRVTDRFNNPRQGVTVNFTTAEGGLVAPSAVTDAAGLARVTWTLGVRAGTQTLVARADTARVNITATATAGPAVSGEIVVPAAVTAGDSVQLQFRTTDEFGNVTTGRAATFTSSNPDIGVVTANGALRGVTAGTITITASADRAVASTTVTIQPFRWSRVNAGEAHACGIAQADSRIYCWGQGTTGALGAGDQADRLIPTAVSGTRTFTRVAAGLQFTCAIGTDQRAYCWGANASGQTGTLTGGTITTPTQVPTTELFADITTGVLGACGLASGRALCWGNNFGVSDFSGGLVFTQISGAPAGGHACGVTADGFVHCWGRNNWGQLGTGNTTDSATPVRVNSPVQLGLVVAGADHTCAVGRDSNTYCWGRADLGQTGTRLLNPTVGFSTCAGGICRLTPAAVEADVNAVRLDAYGHSTCAISTNDEAFCWGLDNGNLGNIVPNNPDCQSLCDPVPTRVATLLRFTELTVGGTFSCGIITTGDVYCWGQNEFGQLGRNRRDAAGTLQIQPVPVFAPRR